MTCPHCEIDYNREAWDQCPHCGEGGEVAVAGVMRTSTIMISAGVSRRTGVYHSVEDVPEPLRRLLEKSTTGRDAVTLLIANERGRREISKAIRSIPLLPEYAGYESDERGAAVIPVRALQRRWRSASAFVFGALLASFAGAVGWLVCVHT